jgi:hypothetical protein
MATKGSTGGQSIEKIRQREEARRQQRKAQKKAPPTTQKQVRVSGFRTLILDLVDFSDSNRQIAYRRLDNLTQYFPKYKYHEHKQKACMEGHIILPDLPGELYVEFLSKMCAEGRGWKQGSMREEVQNG